MKSLKFTLPVFLAICIIFSGQFFTKIEALDSEGSAPNGIPSDNGLVEGGGVISFSSRIQHNEPSDLTGANDTFYKQQWGLAAIQLPAYSDSSPVASRQVRVAILDTGIDSHQEDLQGKVVAETNFTSSPSVSDVNGHGTHIAGIIAASTNNCLGIAGIAPFSQVLNIKVANDQGNVSANTLAKGITWAVENGATVINISIEIAEPSPELEEAVNFAWKNGAVIVAASSNHTEEPIYPAYYSNCIAVAPMDKKGRVGPLSYDESWVDVGAPGYSIYSTLPNNAYGYKSGSSFAVAHVSGLATLLSRIAVDSNGDGKINDEVRAAIETASLNIEGNSIKSIDAAASIAQLNKLADNSSILPNSRS